VSFRKNFVKNMAPALRHGEKLLGSLMKIIHPFNIMVVIRNTLVY
jgi:hypothetical protein